MNVQKIITDLRDAQDGLWSSLLTSQYLAYPCQSYGSQSAPADVISEDIRHRTLRAHRTAA